nr:hypothetical protein [Tanacetum cinerariifolium]
MPAGFWTISHGGVGGKSKVLFWWLQVYRKVARGTKGAQGKKGGKNGCGFVRLGQVWGMD